MPVRGDERGFTMVTLMGVLLVVVSLVFVTYSAADGDLRPGKKDEERKIAYAAAEAGIQNYLFHLTQNDDYWAKCDQVPGPHAVNLAFPGAIPTTANKLQVPGSRAGYVLELLPANGKARCVPGSTDTMIDAATGTFRVRATGFANDPGNEKRSIIASFRRKSFLEYIYFTDFETQDPALYKLSAARDNTYGLNTRENPRSPRSLPQRNVVQWGTETCATTHWAEGRGSLPGFRGDGDLSAGIFSQGAWRDHGPVRCGEIQFLGPAGGPTDGDTAPHTPPGPPDVDVVNGPLHTNDSILVCGRPRFGRTPQDKIEVAGNPGWRGSCTNNRPNVNFSGDSFSKLGTWIPNSAPLTLPPSNDELRADTLPDFRFEGLTKIRLDDDHMFITGRREDGTVLDDAHVLLPADGAIYVRNASGCGDTYDPLNTHPAPAPAAGTGCGNVELEGRYAASLTIGAQNDIVIKEDVLKKNGFGSPTPAPDVLLGLIANNFIRVFHPIRDLSVSTVDDTNPRVVRYACRNDGGPAQHIRIDAAMLSIGHSFIHDSYFCGQPTGTLTVNGAIGQKYRGPVGTSSSGTPVTGFKKAYTYDDRLRYRSPPHFVDPVAAAGRCSCTPSRSRPRSRLGSPCRSRSSRPPSAACCLAPF